MREAQPSPLAESVILRALRRPVWVFDLDTMRFVWANQVALELWDAPTLEHLQQRDFSDMSAAAKTRVDVQRDALRKGQSVVDVWTFYPNGRPLTLQLSGSPLDLEDGRRVLLVEAEEPTSGLAEATQLRSVEALRHSRVPVSLFTLDGELLVQNPAAERTFGDPGEQHAFISRFVRPDEGAAVLTDMARHGCFMTEVLLQTVAGPRWYEVDGHLIIDPATGAHSVLVSMVDVTQRRVAESEAKRLADRFRKLFMEAPLAIFETDAAGLNTFVNPAFTRITGLTETRAAGSGWTSMLHTEDRERVLTEWLNARRHQREYVSQYRCVHVEGAQHWVSVRAAPLFDERGNLYSYIGTMVDVTDLVLAEQKFRLVFESSSLAHIMFNVNGFVDCNEAAVRMFGFADKPELLNQPLMSLLDEELQRSMAGHALADLVDRTTRRGAHVVRVQCRRADGGLFLVESNLVPMVIQGRRVLLAVLRDITERDAAEKAAAAAREAALQASQTKTQFVANMSHEIRTPMNGVLGMLKLALGTALNQEQLEYLTMAHRSAENLLEIINDILDVSKIEAGKLSLEHIEFSFEDLTVDTCTPVAPRAHEKGIELTVIKERALPRKMFGDPTRLRQVITNLLSNAVKFTEQGSVTLSLAVRELDNQEHLDVMVIDTGIGIAPERLNTIFQAFTQVDGSIARKYGGTGLGLTISAQLVSMMGGKLVAQSVPGEGSTFSFSIPLQRATQETLLDGPADLQGVVLIVDDREETRAALAYQVSELGFQPLVADGAEQALSLLEVHDKEIVTALIDHRMPQQDGVELLCTARERGHLRGARTYLLQSRDPLRTAEVLAAGFCGSFSKPVIPSRLSRLLRSRPDTTHEVVAPRLSVQPARSLSVLVAEDHPINARLVITLLKRQGHQPVHVNNGVEVLEKLKVQNFDLVLMDVQMPEMDGLTAVAKIRLREQLYGLPRTPVIALTANAMVGDRETCLAAGMDGYLAKPVDPDRLRSALLDFAGRATLPSEASEVVIIQPADDASFDRSELLERVCGDREFFHEMIKMFLSSSEQLVNDVELSLSAGSDEDIRASAHRLKGALQLVAARHAAPTAQALEYAAKEQCKEAYQSTFLKLRNQVQELRSVLGRELVA